MKHGPAKLANWYVFSLVAFALTYSGYWQLSGDLAWRNEHLLQWQNARWIRPQHQQVNGYFRYHFQVDRLPHKALLQIAATDAFTVYINGRRVGERAFHSTRPSALLDVRSSIKTGENVVAVKVERFSKPGVPELIAELKLINRDASERWLSSGPHWRAETTTKHQAAGTIWWYDLAYVDQSWPYVQMAAGGFALPQQITPEVLETMPESTWVWHPNQAAVNVRFKRFLSIPKQDLLGIWLGVASTGPYAVSINDQALPLKTSSNGVMDLVDLLPYWRGSDNRIAIDASAGDEGGQLAVAGVALTRDGMVTFSADNQWQVRIIGSGESSAKVQWSTPIPLAVQGVTKGKRLFSEPRLQVLSAGHSWQSLQAGAWSFVARAALFYIYFYVITRILLWILASPGTNVTLQQGLCLPLWLATCLVLLAFVLAHDVRILRVDAYRQNWALTILILLPLIQGLIAWEHRWRALQVQEEPT